MPPLTVESYRIDPQKQQLSIEVKLMPALNAINSIFLLVKSDQRSGLGEWINRTASAMAPEERERNLLVTHGLYSALMTGQEWKSFPEFLDFLQTIDPQTLLDNMASALACKVEFQPAEFQAALANQSAYLAFVQAKFDPDDFDLALEEKAYTYLSNPAEMRDMIVSHMRQMWARYLAEEWQRVEPMLADSVRAFQQVDFTGMDAYEAVRVVTGRELEREKFDELFCGEFDSLVFVPSPHIGPYITITQVGKKDYVFFGARLPQGTTYSAPDLSRVEIYNRLNAMSDETRLQILRMISEEGEMRSQEIIARLGLSQPMASRHLTQLSANGFVVERRCDGSKCYRLNSERIRDTLQAIESFLLVHR